MRNIALMALFLAAVLLPGCAAKKQRLADLEAQVQQLQGQLSEAERSRQAMLALLDNAKQAHMRDVERLMSEKEKASRKVLEVDEFADAQRRLAESLKKELGDARARLERTERGLVLTFLDEIFFDSGKAEVKQDGEQTLQKVAAVLKETVPDSPVAVEGHTDNEPIRYSGWKSNWELSAARALAVVHYFTGQQGVSPERLRAVGFGEYHPITANDSPENMRQNRRVEVVILPKAIRKEKPGL